MFNIALFEPEIPPNTGNIIRLASNTGCHLHLIRPLGFSMEDKQLRRAGLDYHEYATVQVYDNWDIFLQERQPPRLFALSTKGTTRYSEAKFEAGDFLLFGPESRGLPVEIREGPGIAGVLTLPMLPHSRSLNLANSVAVVVYEAWRQLGFAASASHTSV
ncbi:MAG: tRNA ((34)/cytosine(34)/5-carboxymethylaminomethyluridine(34)-2-O)-methyltransferase TrmL [Pseudomonadota bacterium]|jgi:tRNA (cytidine/uridine-2'-O-)-methyltransferase